MSFSTVLAGVVAQMTMRLPIWLVWFVALGVAVSRWRRHPGVSGLVVSAVVLFALETVVGSFVTFGAPLLMREAGTTATSVSTLMTVYRLVANIVTAAGWAMLLVAALGWRTPAPPAPPA